MTTLTAILTAAVRIINKDNGIKLKKVAEFGDEDRGAGVYRDPALSEYRVLFVGDGAHLPASDYFTDDKADALTTAQHCTQHDVEPNAAEAQHDEQLPEPPQEVIVDMTSLPARRNRPRGYYEKPSNLLGNLFSRAGLIK